MITTLTILSLDQGRIYSPPPEPVPEQTAIEGEVGASAVAEAQGTQHYLRRVNVSTGLQALAHLLAPTFGGTPAGKAH
ncbi:MULTISPECIES: hypothetical protein [unclassified Rhizobium]|uniref:hypothetical protein n=1 Tax=unclassified Rhizobium TaxID=2613769 RepID=UPI001046E131|nr:MULTISPECIES: hypothetical protein [unclassified Rhizobium]MBB3394125.1 hypothetical protein [Rhizobium sp. BK060]MBB4168133.1 hypothetical protein [Rhizobium sp. BK538]TCM80806.1 hypothetical protein EV291_102260 [Rhizobium sp. BK068]